MNTSLICSSIYARSQAAVAAVAQPAATLLAICIDKHPQGAGGRLIGGSQLAGLLLLLLAQSTATIISDATPV